MKNKLLLSLVIGGSLSVATTALGACIDMVKIKNESGHAAKVQAYYQNGAIAVTKSVGDGDEGSFPARNDCKLLMGLKPEFEGSVPAGFTVKGKEYKLDFEELCKMNEENAYFVIKKANGHLVLEKVVPAAEVPMAPAFEAPPLEEKTASPAMPVKGKASKELTPEQKRAEEKAKAEA